MNFFVETKSESAVLLTPVTASTLEGWTKRQDARTANWVSSSGFKAGVGKALLISNDKGELTRVLAGVGEPLGLWDLAGLPHKLPETSYCLDEETTKDWTTDQFNQACFAWALGHYGDRRFKSDHPPAKLNQLVWPTKAQRTFVKAAVEGTCLARDLINAPTNKLGPAELADAAKTLAKTYKADVKTIVGKDLLKANYPAIYVVGQAVDQKKRAPRLVDFSWGSAGPKITLVGKGVCFDTGGLNLKSAAGMSTMKKDMGGAAQVLGLASMIMAMDLKVQLRVLIPTVENSVNGDAYRPQDIIDTRKGLTVEIGNTDAEGRLILSDALTEGSSEKPDLIVDFATLTGAARVALGTDLPALFCNDDEVAGQLQRLSEDVQDPLWRMPLHQPYKKNLSSPFADLNNISPGGYGGAITAALFLEHFVENDVPWIHIDLMAWNLKSTPGRPVGGEAMGVRALYALISEKASM